MQENFVRVKLDIADTDQKPNDGLMGYNDPLWCAGRARSIDDVSRVMRTEWLAAFQVRRVSLQLLTQSADSIGTIQQQVGNGAR